MFAPLIVKNSKPYQIASRLKRRIVKSPMRKVLAELRRREGDLSRFSALEFFGYTGINHTVDYAGEVGRLEIWEIDPSHERFLRRNLPMADIKITDSLEALKRTQTRFGLVVLDDPIRWGPGGSFCESFDLFPDILRLLSDEAILVLNVTPSTTPKIMRKVHRFFDPRHLERRAAFYKTDRPHDVSISHMMEIYRQHCEGKGFQVQWYFSQKRVVVTYLVIRLRRNQGLAAGKIPTVN